jgi:hypothetical protein
MNETTIRPGQAEEAPVFLDVTDQALEVAANSGMEARGAYTLSFCTGLDSCPA